MYKVVAVAVECNCIVVIDSVRKGSSVRGFYTCSVC